VQAVCRESGRADAMPVEIELKLDVPVSAAQRFATAPWLKKLAIGAPKKEKLVSVYYDTQDFALRGHRAALRVRKTGGRYVETLKTEDNAAQSFLGRGEWECELDDAHPDLRKIGKDGLNGLDRKMLDGELKPIFETAVTRTVIPVRYNGADLEIAVDVGQVRTGRKTVPIHEIEIELKNGHAAAVVQLGTRIARSLHAAYGVASNAERGYALHEGTVEDAATATPIVLDPEMKAAEAFKVIGLSCLHHFASNRDAIAAGDPEGVHQMRIGLRRLRAAMSVFKEMLRDQEMERLKGQLEWLGDALGPARDMHVMMSSTIAALEKEGTDARAVESLKREIVQKRVLGFRQAKAAVKSERYRKIVLDAAFWLAGGNWAVNGDELMRARREQVISAFATTELDRRFHKILKKVDKLRELDALHRHKLRIAVKKLRYAAEFFDSLFDRDNGRKKFAKALKSLQTSLGELNDIRVHDRLAGQFAGPQPGPPERAPKAFAMGLIAGEERSKSKRLLSDAAKAGKKLESIKPFWN
jgi:triphosphatase